MKKTISLVFVILFLALCLVPSLGLALTGGSGAAANQVLAAKPALTKKDGSFNKNVLSDFVKYVNDRFFLRQEAVTAWAELNGTLLRSSVTEDVILGREGWLYFTPTLPDYMRSDPMTERELWCAARRLWLLQEYCEAQGAQFLFTVAPNKNTLYPDKMPASLPKGEGPSNTERLYEKLDEMEIAHLDLAAVFRAEDGAVLYFASDSHWTSWGAALAADAILGALGRESAYFTEPRTGAWHRGDLYEMLCPAGAWREQDTARVRSYTFTASSDDPDSITIKTQSAAGEGALLMYRDSFGRSLYPYLAETYAEAVFSRKNDYNPTAVQPGGALVIELVERNLRYLLDNDPTLPAPLRDAALAEGAQSVGARAKIALAKGGPEGYTVLRGDLGGLTPDDESPVYLETAQGLFEALPGAEGFSLCLPEAAAQGPLRLLFFAEGRLVALTAERE